MKHVFLIAFSFFSLSLIAQSGGVGISPKPYEHLSPQAPRRPVDTFGIAEVAVSELPIPDDATVHMWNCLVRQFEMGEEQQELRERIRDRVVNELGPKWLEPMLQISGTFTVTDESKAEYIKLGTLNYMIAKIVKEEIRDMQWDLIDCDGSPHGYWMNFSIVL